VNPLKALAEEQNQEHPYEAIIAREVRSWLDHSQMVGVAHINPISGEDYFKARVAFHKQGMQLKMYGRRIMRKAVTDTKYEALLKLVNTMSFSTAYIFCPDHNDVSKMLKVLKKLPQLHLMCGIAENRLMSKNELVSYASMPDIDVVRSQFANVLNLAASQLVQNLESHQNNLVNILDAHVRESEKPKEPEDK